MVDAVDPFLPKPIYRMSKKNRAKIASPDIVLNEEDISIRSEERRVGKECSTRGSSELQTRKKIRKHRTHTKANE